MSMLAALVALAALAGISFSAGIVLRHLADRRLARGQGAVAPSRSPRPRTSTSETVTVTRLSTHRASYLEVGEWSGRTHPPGAVVVGYDGKAHSRAAVAWAAHEAARRDVALVVLYAANYPGMTGEPGPGLYHRDQGALEAAEEVTASGVAMALASVPWLDVAGATEVTAPGQALVEASREASLVVVGRRGSPRFFRSLRRSVGLALARSAHAPVVVVRGGTTTTDQGSASGPLSSAPTHASLARGSLGTPPGEPCRSRPAHAATRA